ncbi:Microsomal glutathione S-transferase 3 [Chytriomyces hyalinus]|nr:Microsomal glutathione S-transferase 3 [Chytriomyces hyalinus]
MATITLTWDHGYVLGVGALSTLYPFVLGAQIGKARKRAQVPYPFMYATQAECAADKSKLIFNCYQRAHQNFLENYPAFLFLLVAGGVEHPRSAAIAGIVWLYGRSKYSKNYQSGDPSKRNSKGAVVHYFALTGLFCLTAKTAVKFMLKANGVI